MFRFKLNLQLFADADEKEKEKEKSPYDVVLEDNAAMRKELTEMHAKLNQMYDMNRALLSRKEPNLLDKETKEKQDKEKEDKAVTDKFNNWLKGDF